MTAISPASVAEASDPPNDRNTSPRQPRKKKARVPRSRETAQRLLELRDRPHARWVDRKWRIALEIVRDTATRAFFRNALASETRLAIQYLRLRERGSHHFEGSLTDLHQAWSLRFEAGVLTRAELEARLLCQSVEETAAAMSLPAEVVELYESLFFAVRAKIDSPVYIFANAIGTQVWTGCAEADVDIVLKTIAYAHGPIVLGVALEYYRSWYVPSHLEGLSKAELQKLLHLVQIKVIIEALTQSSMQAGPEPAKHRAGDTLTSWRTVARELRQYVDDMSEQTTKPPSSLSLSPTTINWLVWSYHHSAVKAEFTQKSALAG